MTSTDTNTQQFSQQSSWEDAPETNNAKLESSPMLNTPSTANGDATTCISPGMDSTNGRDSLGQQQILNPPTSPGIGGGVVIEEEAQQEFEEIAGRVRELCRCQSGSRYLQRQLTKGHPQVASLILKEVEDEITGLMMDQYGNYLCQQLFQASAVYERRTMLTKLAPDAFKIACDRRGTHALQALIGLLSTAEEELILLHVLQSKLLDLATDVNGTHVVQRILICFSTDATDMVFGPVIRNLPKIAQNPYGLCVVKKCISQASRSAHFDGMMKTISHHALDLMQSPYGNYAVQHALECWGGQACRDIVRQVLGRTLQLSIQKFSSNVVEKCIEYADEEYRHKIIEELMECEKMSVLISSNYG